MFKLLQEKQELSRGKCENGQPRNSHPKSREKRKMVTLVCGPFNKGHLQPKRANLLERSHLSWQQVSHPRNPLPGVFCLTHCAQGMGHPKGTPRDHIPLNSPDSQVPLSAKDKLNLQRWLCLVKPRNPLSHCSTCPFTPQVVVESEKKGLSGNSIPRKRTVQRVLSTVGV